MIVPFNDPDFFDKLILEGAMEPAGMDEDGEMLFNFTKKLPEVSPEMHERLAGNIQNDVRTLWELGFLDFNILEENPLINITAKALNRNALEELPPYYRQLLANIKEAMRSE
jgi:hypothetical protein